MKKKLPLLGYKVRLDNQDEFIFDLGVEVQKARFVVIAKEIGLTRTSLYKVFKYTGRPSFLTIMKCIDALGYKITITKK